MTTFRTIELDPPWEEKGGGKRGADVHFKTLSTPEIVRTVLTADAWRPAMDGCHVWLWAPSWRVTNGEAAFVLRALGARPVRKLTWVKTADVPRRGLFRWGLLKSHRRVGSYVRLTAQGGLGQYGRGAHEDCVLGVIGSLAPLDTARSVLDVIFAPVPKNEAGRRRHSAKPLEAYERIEAISPGPRLTMFARARRPGWVGWGDEYEGRSAA